MCDIIFKAIRKRIYVFLIPWFMDGGIVFLQTAMPLLVVRLGASALLLGSIGWIAQAVRLPVCLLSGHLSERVGRTAVIVPAACSCAIGCLLMSFAKSPWQVMPFYVLALASIGGFYAPLQALIGDVSERGELRNNLGAFNIGWCAGSAVAALVAPILVRLGLNITLYAGAAASLTAAVLVLSWQRASRRKCREQTPDVQEQHANQSLLLLIARIGHFLSYYGYSTIRIMFPKYAITGMGWSEVTVTWVTAQHLVGLSLGIMVVSASGWWRSRLWPLAGAQLVMAASALLAVTAHTPVPVAIAFFAFGVSQSVVYTAALYYGISGSGKRGRNAGVHESLVAAGGISGCLVGGLAAQKIALGAPFVILAGLAGLALVVSLILGFAKKKSV